jgi:hypothetical protein
MLKVGLGGPSCSFTANIAFAVTPSKGDRLLVALPDLGQVGITITEVCHFLSSEPTCLFITSPLIVHHYDQMLMVIDWFKLTYEVDGFESEDQPAPYYKFYRSLINLLGWSKVADPIVRYDPVEIKIVAEACRAVALAELRPDEFMISGVSLNPMIQSFHSLVLNSKKTEPDGARLLGLVKAWEKLFNSKKLITWDASGEECLEAARFIFGRLNSIPADRLPITLRIQECLVFSEI